MPAPARASASVVAAGIMAIIGAGFAALFNIRALIAFQFGSAIAPGAAIPPAIRPLLNLIWLFFLACAVFVIVVGVQLIRLRNWARITLLIAAGCMLFFGVIGIGVILFTIFITPVDPAVSKSLLATVLAFIYGIPVGVALWWLILLTRRSVAEQFQQGTASLAVPPGGASLPSSSFFNNPQCPLAIRIVGWYLASFVLFLPIVPFLPIRVPAFYLGHIFRGPSATMVLFANLLVLSVAGVGLLLVKRWSYALTIATQLFLCANGLFAVLSPSFEAVIRETFSEMHLPDLPFGVEQMFHSMRFFNLSGLIVPIAIVVTLFVCRRAFFAAANSAARSSFPTEAPPSS